MNGFVWISGKQRRLIMKLPKKVWYETTENHLYKKYSDLFDRASNNRYKKIKTGK